MVQVQYRNQPHLTHWVTAPQPEVVWQIRLRYRFNPLTNRAHDYAPDYYRRVAQAGSDCRVTEDTPEAWRVRAIQVMLHQQTNYDDLLRAGLYDLPFARVREILRSWYQEIARRFPRYRVACELEYVRHLRKYEARHHSQQVSEH